ncbi:NADH-quinone oxidoreductase subunit L [Candidatus Omnitrophota bacterium]
MPVLSNLLQFKLDYLNGFISLAILVFFVLITLYSLKFMRARPRRFEYYLWMVLTAIASVGAVLANNLILLLILWGFLGLTLYLLINLGDEASDKTAKKTFIIVGASDSLMLLGIVIIYHLTGTFQMDKIQLAVGSSQLAMLAFICLAIAAFAKAGAMPFHSWIPDCAEHAPLPVVAFLPASLDKLLGIYLLARVCLNLFVMNQAMNIFLMLIGAFTILAAVMMAMVQHNLKRLLGYHAVSQVGYMVLGIGTGNPIGIAGGIFHMLNHAVYKSCLFLTGGNIESKTNTSELDKLGGLGKLMPLTYFACLVASFSISGVPPFNGFVSKWMVYQGLVAKLNDTGLALRFTSILCLVAAMIGSALTLASFMKLIHATFLGQRLGDSASERVREVNWTMWLPCLILAGICVLFGIFAFAIPLKYFVLPALTGSHALPASGFLGFWSPGVATLLIIAGLIIGLVVFKLGRLSLSFREDAPYIGGEPGVLEKSKVSGTEFYNTVKEINILSRFYKLAEEKCFDIYDVGQRIVFGINGVLRHLHNGVLPTYLVWCLLGMMVMFFVLK